MPAIVRLSNSKICIFPGDHAPPHFHLKGPGWIASIDIVTLEILKGKFAYLGSGGGKIAGNQKLQCVMTLFGGKILYDHPYGLSVPLWQDIPKDSRYWADTTKQKT